MKCQAVLSSFSNMKNFWEKAKNQVALGVASVKEATGNESVQEEPAYLELSAQIKEQGKKLEDLQKAVKDYQSYVEKFSSAQYTVSGQMASLFKPEDPTYVLASSAHQQQEAVYTNAKNLAGTYLNQHVLNPIKDLLEQLGSIYTAEKKRKRNKVLLVEAEKDLTKAKDKGKVKDIGEIQEKIAKRQNKYTKYDSDFNTLSKQFLEKCSSVYTQVFNAYQFYVAEYFEQGKEKAIDSVPGFQYNLAKGQYPSISVVPVQQPAPAK